MTFSTFATKISGDGVAPLTNNFHEVNRKSCNIVVSFVLKNFALSVINWTNVIWVPISFCNFKKAIPVDFLREFCLCSRMPTLNVSNKILGLKKVPKITLIWIQKKLNKTERISLITFSRSSLFLPQ